MPDYIPVEYREYVFLTAPQVFKILGVSRSKGYAFLREVEGMEKPYFRVEYIGATKMIRIPAKSFWRWVESLNALAG